VSDGQDSAFGDPTTAPFWAAAERRALIVQKCHGCAAHQFYPRPFCLACGSDRLAWVEASGRGTIYAMTTVHMQASPEFEPPYVVAIVELDEGPKMMTNIVNGSGRIGDHVRVVWKERPGKPPVPNFEPMAGEG
jgi:uncharacterized OB-fold protein